MAPPGTSAAYSPTREDLFFPARRGQFFDAGPPRTEAELCAEMSRLAYCRREPAFSFDTDLVDQALAGIQFTAQYFQSKGTPSGMGTHCLLTTRTGGDPNRNLNVVAFRGTDSTDPLDLLDDANLFQVKWSPGGRVHAGFAHALEPVGEDLLQALAACSGRVLFTGHSLGAALATLLASLRRPNALFTYGSPRVGDEAFVATLESVANYRFVDCCDLVTRVPPPSLPGIPYVHVGDPWYIAEDRSVRQNPSEDFIQADRQRAALRYVRNYAWKSGNVRVRELADHAPINYVWPLAAAPKALTAAAGELYS